MINALQCIFVALIIVHKGSRAVPDNDFRPTPIPLDKLQGKRAGSSGTLQEIVKIASPASVAAVPVHYWEDALRHSVYLTLVRDKIDQLIAKDAVKSDNNKSEPVTKEDDDRDMWEKIKSAPFDRLIQETTAPGDISVLAKGRLLEHNGRYMFAEDATTSEKCVDVKCMQGVKAFWSVKRERQRGAETQPGKYHYELTFSITSQSLQKQNKSLNNPVRTFTVRESPPRDMDPINHSHRSQRAVWVHKNIVPPTYHESHQRNQGVDRFFSSLFSVEDAYDLPKYKQQQVFVQHQFPQLSKVGNIGAFGNQRKLMPYPYKPQPYKHLRHPLPTQPPPIVQPYIDFEKMFNNPYPFSHGDHKMLPSNIIKTTRPAFLPTPVMPVSFPNKVNFSTDSITKLNISETITKEPQFGTTYKSYNKPKPTPVKVSYFTDYVRPPVFNAPPGVFVTMNNKPFKPMPPLKLIHNSKSKPIDFRPSPQVLDGHLSDPDSSSVFAFRPITLEYTNNTTVKSDITDTNKKRKLYSTVQTSSRKPPKEVINMKSQRTTTTAPEIITVHNDNSEEEDPTKWVNLLEAFSKTTPMASEKMKSNTTESPVPSLTSPISTTTAMKSKDAYITTTMVISTKRTRPPPKFTKPNKNKIKKHKRLTSSTSTTTTTAPQIITVKATTQDLQLQASSVTTNDKSKNKTLSTTPLTTLSSTTITTTSRPTITTPQPTTTTPKSTTTPPQPTTITTQPTTITPQSTTTTPKPTTTPPQLTTTTKPLTTTAQTTSTTLTTSTINTTTEVELPATTQPKYKNRYRQSTVMRKGTSVKHDRWSTRKYKTVETHKPPRRNESNFQKYNSTTLKSQIIELNKEHQIQHLSSLPPKANNSNEKITTEIESTSLVQPEYENSVDQYATSSEGPTVIVKENDKEDPKEKQIKDNSDQDIKDQNEYIFNLTSTSTEESNDIDDNVITTEQIIITSPKTIAKNKTRCKKKKHNNTTTMTTKLHNNLQHEVTTVISNTTTENSLASGFFDELLRSFNTDTTVEKQSKPQPVVKVTGESESFERFSNNDDFRDFQDSLEDNHEHYNDKSEEIYEDDDRDSSLEYSPFNNEEENHAARVSNDQYTDYQDHPYTLFELMAME